MHRLSVVALYMAHYKFVLMIMIIMLTNARFYELGLTRAILELFLD